MFTRLKTIALVLLAAILSPKTILAQVDAFAQPLREIVISTDETGLIKTMTLKPGDRVESGQTICQLADDLQKLQVKQAELEAAARGKLLQAEVAWLERQEYTKLIEELDRIGSASATEPRRAKIELHGAKARYIIELEAIEQKEIELEKSRFFLSKRKIVAPFNGVVSKVHKHEGELISPVKPEILTLIQTDTLKAEFNVHRVGNLKAGSIVRIQVASDVIEGTVDSIGFTKNADSSTVVVTVHIPNEDGAIRSGEKCILLQ